MDRLNKWYKDSSWRKKADANDAVRTNKEVAKDFDLKVTCKILPKNKSGFYTVMAKVNHK